MQSKKQALIQDVHDTPYQLVYVAAGAGTEALNALFSIAGASRTVLECHVPYSKASFVEFLGREPQKYVSMETAGLLAGRALTRAQLLSEDDATPLVGVSCTATIVTDSPKRGDHRAYIVTWQADQVVGYHLNMKKGARDRAGEERLVSNVVLNAIARATSVKPQLELNLIQGDELKETVFDFGAVINELYEKDINYFGVHDFGRIRKTGVSPQVLLSGSFNPLHAGHLGIAAAATKHLGKPVAFEISAFNVDKPPLDKQAALKRLTQFSGQHAVYLSNAPTFVEKTRIYGETTFVVGYDTAKRILQKRYYNDSNEEMLARLNEMLAINSHFLVADRIGDDGIVYSVDELEMEAEFRPMFSRLPDFRLDISSSELRKAGLKGSR